LQTALANVQALIDDSGARIEIGEMPKLQSIEILLVQLFQNLISNAIKYRSAAAPVIEISARTTPEGCIFTVTDNGVGIDSQYFDYIFGVFRRLEAGERSGTGMGLAICKAAVERLGGRIWVESVPGQGSCFSFFLPKGICDEISVADIAR
jgi:light-regulated signal transduction histidine kinase (bacteriophytochrome)